MKKFISACLALVMALMLAVPAFAMETPDMAVIGGADGPTMISIATLTQQPATQEQVDALLTAKGGTPGQINVMVNGQCVPFSGVYPTLLSGRTMVPLRGVLEFLGAKVDYDAATRTAAVAGEGVAFTHVIGTDKITLSNGETLTMDVASAVQSGSTLVPLRFFSQALGYDVYWDKDYRTAVVIDKAAFIAEFDKTFTILNSYMAQQYKSLDLTKPLSEDLTLSADVKIIDSINGDQTYKISGSINMAMDDKALGLSGSLDLGDLAKLWDAVVLPLTDQVASPEVTKALSPLTFDIVTSGNEVYVKSPLVSYIMQSSGYAIPAGEVWFALDADGLTELLAQYTQMMAKVKTMTFGQVIYEVCALIGAENGITMYDTMAGVAQLYQQMMGDATWTRTGSTYRWHFGERDFEKLMETLSGEKISLTEAGITKYTIDMTLGQNGKVDMSMEMAAQGMKFTMKGSGSAAKSSFTGSLQVQNVCDVNFKMDAAVKTGGKVPALPDGAKVLREAELQMAS